MMNNCRSHASAARLGGANHTGARTRWPSGSSKAPGRSKSSRPGSRRRSGRHRHPGDGRTVGVVVHHVASMYPLEIQLAQALAGGKPITGVTWERVHELNAEHARTNNAVTKQAASSCFAATAPPPPRPSARSATRSSIARQPSPSTPTPR